MSEKLIFKSHQNETELVINREDFVAVIVRKVKDEDNLYDTFISHTINKDDDCERFHLHRVKCPVFLYPKDTSAKDIESNHIQLTIDQTLWDAGMTDKADLEQQTYLSFMMSTISLV